MYIYVYQIVSLVTSSHLEGSWKIEMNAPHPFKKSSKHQNRPIKKVLNITYILTLILTQQFGTIFDLDMVFDAKYNQQLSTSNKKELEREEGERITK